jgi:hypothetical protein
MDEQLCKDCVFWIKERKECIAKNKDQDCPYTRMEEIIKEQQERLKKEGN